MWTTPPSSGGEAVFCNVFHKETRMEKRILAVLLAAFAGSAAAQTYVTSGASSSVAPGVASPPQATQLAQSTVTNERPANERRTSTSASAAGATTSSGNPPPPSSGYVGSGAGVVATNPFGLCWRGGMEWSPEHAAAPCDAVPRAANPPVPVARAE